MATPSHTGRALPAARLNEILDMRGLSFEEIQARGYSLLELCHAWRPAFDRSCDASLPPDEAERCTAICLEIERMIDAEPAATMEELALKVRILSHDWALMISPEETPDLCAEIETLSEGLA